MRASRRARLGAAALAGLLAAPVWAQVGQVDKGAAQKSTVPISGDEKAFLEWIHHVNQEEIKVGQLAQQKAVSKESSDFGAMMVRDHQAADERVTAYAKQRGWNLGNWQPSGELERRIQAAGEADAAKLRILEGPAFEQALFATMVGDHDFVLARIRAGAQKFPQSADVVNGIAPKLEAHRSEAYRILGTKRPSAS
jgi:putative membrane protein